MSQITIAAAPQAPDSEAVWQSLAMPRASRIAFEDVERAGLVTRMGDGCYAVGGALAQLIARLDNRIRTMAVDVYGAVENCYPSIIPTGVLHKAGYFDSFPQFLMTAGRFRAQDDASAYQGFASEFEAAEGADGRAKFMDGHTEHAGYCLSPTVCYHTYHQFAGRQVPDEGSVITACGKNFRFESQDHRTLERLWDFTMREVVFLGSRDTVVRLRGSMLDAVCRLIDELRLAAHVEVANDPFFAGGASTTARRVMAQRALKLKYELRMPVVEGRYIAVGSFNIHDTKFGKAFDITTPDGAPAYSGCIGIGFERLAYAFLCRHGIDPSAWPEF